MAGTHRMEEVFELPADIRLEYFAEGGANIIYRIIPRETPLPGGIPTEADLHDLPRLGSKSTPPPISISPATSPRPRLPVQELLESSHPPLLRLRKAVPHLPSIQEQHNYYTTKITPLFAPHTVLTQYLILLPTDLPTKLNKELREAEVKPPDPSERGRPAKRYGTYLPPTSVESHGTLLTDLTPTTRNEILLELKPKWLCQSQSAPDDATRCRTCALRAMRDGKGVDPKAVGNMSAMCPLDLRESDPAAVDAIMHAHDLNSDRHLPGVLDEIRATLINFLRRDDGIIQRLAMLQLSNDHHGILRLPLRPPKDNPTWDEVNECHFDNFLIATTLRDCTLFILLVLGWDRNEPGGSVRLEDAKLGDLDLKRPEPGKLEYWRGMERDLIDGGWYSGGGDKITGGSCRLEKIAWKRKLEEARRVRGDYSGGRKADGS